MCDKNIRNISCGAVECGDGYCSWWQNYACNNDDQFSIDTMGSFHTCLKMFDDDVYGKQLTITDFCVTVCFCLVLFENVNLTITYNTFQLFDPRLPS